MNIYVGNIARSTTEETLKKAFQEYGEVNSVKIIKDRLTNESRGFAFVEMAVEEEGREAIKNMDQKELDGRKLRVNEANPSEARPPRSRDKRFSGNNRNGNGGGNKFRSNNRY